MSLLLPPLHERRRAHQRPRLGRGGANSPRIGYYTRPPNLFPSAPDLGDPEQAAYVTLWNDQNQRDGADAFYVDIIGRGHSGSPSAVGGFVDIRPAYFAHRDRRNRRMVITETADGDRALVLQPGFVPTHGCLYTPMLRYLMADRLAFLVPMRAPPGQGGETFWGDDGDGYNDVDCDDVDWGARQAFLLGLKLAYTPHWDEVYATSTVKQVNDLRQSFWDQRPSYRHRYRLTTPAGVDARTFRMSDGHHEVAVENCSGAARSITFAGTSRPVPPGLSLQVF